MDVRHRVLLVAVGSPGRWNPLIAVARRLCGPERHIGVVLVRTRPHAALDPRGECAELGIDYRSIGDEPFPTASALRRQLADPALHLERETHLRVTLADLQVDATLAAIRAFGPDVLVVDNLAYQGVIAAMLAGMPWIGFSASNRLALSDVALETEIASLRPIEATRDDLFASRGLSPVAFRSWEAISPHLNLVPSCTALVGADAPLPPHSVLVGPFHAVSRRDSEPFPWHAIDPVRPLVYVSFGSIWSHQPALYATVAEAAAPLGVQLVIACGDLATAGFARSLAGDPVVVRYAPQPALLPRAACFVTHGGMNSVNEALCCGVPLIVLPQANDQFAQAYSVEQAGAGLWIRSREWSVADCRDALRALSAPDNSYRAAAATLQRSFSAQDGAPVAAHHILDRLARAPG